MDTTDGEHPFLTYGPSQTLTSEGLDVMVESSERMVKNMQATGDCPEFIDPGVD